MSLFDCAPQKTISGAKSGPVKQDGIVYRIFKRQLDVVVSLIVISLTLPLMIFISFYIKSKSKQAAVFKQTRVREERRKIDWDNWYYSGVEQRKIEFFGRPFRFYKFQTMYPDAAKRFPELYKYQYSTDEIKQIKFKIDDDPRVPTWAKWLRKSSLDELPNFFNVLKGDMTLVGPRPDIPEMIKYYTPEQRLKLTVKPGVTGLAQIMGRGDLTFQETLKYDVEYVKNRTFRLDLKILFKTLMSTVTQRGAF